MSSQNKKQNSVSRIYYSANVGNNNYQKLSPRIAWTMMEKEERMKFISDPNANDEEGDETHRHNDTKSIKDELTSQFGGKSYIDQSVDSALGDLDLEYDYDSQFPKKPGEVSSKGEPSTQKTPDDNSGSKGPNQPASCVYVSMYPMCLPSTSVCCTGVVEQSSSCCGRVLTRRRASEVQNAGAWGCGQPNTGSCSTSRVFEYCRNLMERKYGCSNDNVCNSISVGMQGFGECLGNNNTNVNGNGSFTGGGNSTRDGGNGTCNWGGGNGNGNSGRGNCIENGSGGGGNNDWGGGNNNRNGNMGGYNGNMGGGNGNMFEGNTNCNCGGGNGNGNGNWGRGNGSGGNGNWGGGNGNWGGGNGNWGGGNGNWGGGNGNWSGRNGNWGGRNGNWGGSNGNGPGGGGNWNGPGGGRNGNWGDGNKTASQFSLNRVGGNNKQNGTDETGSWVGGSGLWKFRTGGKPIPIEERVHWGWKGFQADRNTVTPPQPGYWKGSPGQPGTGGYWNGMESDGQPGTSGNGGGYPGQPGSTGNPGAGGAYGSTGNPGAGGAYGSTGNPGAGGAYGSTGNPGAGGAYGSSYWDSLGLPRLGGEGPDFGQGDIIAVRIYRKANQGNPRMTNSTPYQNTPNSTSGLQPNPRGTQSESMANRPISDYGTVNPLPDAVPQSSQRLDGPGQSKSFFPLGLVNLKARYLGATDDPINPEHLWQLYDESSGSGLDRPSNINKKMPESESSWTDIDESSDEDTGDQKGPAKSKRGKKSGIKE